MLLSRILNRAILGSVVFVADAAVGSQPVEAQSTGCAPVLTHYDTIVVSTLRESIRAHVKDYPRFTWNGLKLQRADTATIQVVHDDSLCAAALRALRAHLIDPRMVPRGIRMASVGSYFVAQSIGDGSRNEFQHYIFLFDSTLTKVLFPCRDGLFCDRLRDSLGLPKLFDSSGDPPERIGGGSTI